jgi:hypothetical protein
MLDAIQTFSSHANRLAELFMVESKPQETAEERLGLCQQYVAADCWPAGVETMIVYQEGIVVHIG